MEPELAAPPPRTTAWCDRSGEPLPAGLTRKLERYRSVKGWLAAMEVVPDFEGPDYHLWFAWELDGRVHQHYRRVGYDTTHWAMSYPESYQWFRATMKVGGAVTLLIGDDGDCLVYGLCEPFVRRGTSRRWAAA